MDLKPMGRLFWKLSLWSFVFVILFFGVGQYAGSMLPEFQALHGEPETGCFHLVAYASYYKCAGIPGGESISWALNQARFPDPVFFLSVNLSGLAEVFSHPEWLSYGSFWRKLGLTIAYVFALLFPVMCLLRLFNLLGWQNQQPT